MDKNFKEKRSNGRNFNNDRRNHEKNSRTKKDNEDQINVVSELWEELNEAFSKGCDISKEKLDDSEIGKSKSIIEFYSTTLN